MNPRDRLLLERVILVIATLLISGRTITLPNFPLDPSWRAALAIAHADGLRFGDQIDFTFGPWGWLDVNVSTSRAGAIAPILFGLVTSAFFVWVAWTILSRRLSRTTALILLVVVVPLAMNLSFDEILLAAVLGSSLLLVERFADGRIAPARTASVLGCVAASMLFIKLSTGIFAILMVIIVSLCWWRSPLKMAAIVGATLVSIPMWWFLSEFSFEHFVEWFRTSISIAIGYPGGQAKTMLQPLNYVMFLALVAVVILLTVKRLRSNPSGRTNTVVTSLLIGLSLFIALKLGFVREEQLRVASVFTISMIVVAWLLPPSLSLVRRTLVVLFPATVAVVTLAAPGTSHHSAFDLLDVSPAAGAWSHNVNLVASSSMFGQEVEKARQTNKDVFRLSDEMVERLAGLSVQVDPWQTSLPWTYEVPWAPVPIFQSYVVLTERADRVNTDAVDSRDESQAILIDTKRPDLIDGRMKLWSSPNYQMAITCRFHLTFVSGSWELWQKNTVDRCGEAQIISTHKVRSGDVVSIPSPEKGFLTVARYSPNISTLDRLVSAVFKPSRESSLVMSGTRIQTPWGLSGSPLLVSCPPAPKLTNRYELVCPDPTELVPSDDGEITFERIPYTTSP